MEQVLVRPFTHVVKKGDQGDAMYLVLDGELRSCIMVDGIESPVATLTPGSIFGEISLLDRGPHAADVISNQESTLIKISSEAFSNVVREAPQCALPFVLSLSKSIAGRVRILTRRYEDSVHLAQVGEV
jgi:CRP-like cAMP-binding protein